MKFFKDPHLRRLWRFERSLGNFDFCVVESSALALAANSLFPCPHSV